MRSPISAEINVMPSSGCQFHVRLFRSIAYAPLQTAFFAVLQCARKLECICLDVDGAHWQGPEVGPRSRKWLTALNFLTLQVYRPSVMYLDPPVHRR